MRGGFLGHETDLDLTPACHLQNDTRTGQPLDLLGGREGLSLQGGGLSHPWLTRPIGQNLGGTRRHEGVVVVQVWLQLGRLLITADLMDTLEKRQAGVSRRLPPLLRDPCEGSNEGSHDIIPVGRSLQ